MSTRKAVKDENKTLQISSYESSHPHVKALDHQQYALNIVNNSLYGCMGFRQYNNYSPRFAMSVAGTRRWALTTMRCGVEAMCLRCVYGDTESIIWTLGN